MRKKLKIIRDKLKDQVINDIKTLFETDEEKKDRKKKEQNERIIKDKILFEISEHFLSNKKKIIINLKE